MLSESMVSSHRFAGIDAGRLHIIVDCLRDFAGYSQGYQSLCGLQLIAFIFAMWTFN
jgi:hypothetical protein